MRSIQDSPWFVPSQQEQHAKQTVNDVTVSSANGPQAVISSATSFSDNSKYFVQLQQVYNQKVVSTQSAELSRLSLLGVYTFFFNSLHA